MEDMGFFDTPLESFSLDEFELGSQDIFQENYSDFAVQQQNKQQSQINTTEFPLTEQIDTTEFDESSLPTTNTHTNQQSFDDTVGLNNEALAAITTLLAVAPFYDLQKCEITVSELYQIFHPLTQKFVTKEPTQTNMNQNMIETYVSPILSQPTQNLYPFCSNLTLSSGKIIQSPPHNIVESKETYFFPATTETIQFQESTSSNSRRSGRRCMKSRKGDIPCQNLAMMDEFGISQYCAEHIDFDITSPFHRCKFELFCHNAKSCKEIIRREFRCCHKHLEIWLEAEFTGEDGLEKTKKLISQTNKIVQEQRTKRRGTKKIDQAYYHRMCKQIPKYNWISQILVSHHNKLQNLPKDFNNFGDPNNTCLDSN